MTTRAETIAVALPRMRFGRGTLAGSLLALGAIEAALCVRYWGSPFLPADCFFGVLALACSVTDLREHRLPKRLVWPSYPVLLGLVALGAGSGAGWGALTRAAVAMAICAAAAFVYALALAGRFGLGDVRLLGLIGAVCGADSYATVLAAVFLAYLLASVVTVPLLVTRRLTWKSRVPLGVFLLAGAVAALLVVR